MASVSIFLIFSVMVALIAGMAGCVPVEHDLTITSTAGSSVPDVSGIFENLEAEHENNP